MALQERVTVGVAGAGAMGSGIAQVAAAAGNSVVIADAVPGAAAKAKGRVAKGIEGQVAKGKMSRADADALLGRIDFRERPIGDDMSAFAECGLVIEAIVEDLGAKKALFRQLEEVVDASCVLATNTSSLSVTSLGGERKNGGRFIGLHFFNPAQVMPLVEIIPWAGTAVDVKIGAQWLMESWGKTPVIASDTPGFIVNRIARPFYGEAIRIAEEGIADYATIDRAVRDLGKFRMGPFELMDFIGNDVNFAVTKSVYEAMFHDPRYRPSLTQQRLVEAGFLGRKSGRGYYTYTDGVPGPVANIDPVVGLLAFERILAMLINEAVDAVPMRVATPKDIDLAMTKGVNYPKGLLAWCDELGAERVLGWMTHLQAEYGEDRYRPSPLLRRMAAESARFFA
ncbi:MAG TPA: 3-hydroxyacyl-CoA dehydrogenase NAD-binding domain-containing protein [Gemmatimonadaceae bacterium]|nr:3-hydroxyacyl-CoA dehydrogenase NAD-binding domain-containing protein [Gemmatimonadaceae bacterium]